MEGCLTDKQAEMATLELVMEEMERERDSARKEKDVWMEEHQRVESALEAVESRIDELEDANAGLSAQVERLQRQLSAQQGGIDGFSLVNRKVRRQRVAGMAQAELERVLGMMSDCPEPLTPSSPRAGG